MGLKQKHLYQGSSLFMKMYASLYDLGVVIDKERAWGKVLGDMLEYIVGDIPLVIDEQLTLVTLGNRIFGYPLVRKWVVIVLYLYMLGRGHLFLVKD